MSRLARRLMSLLEAWEKGSKTAYGKREGLPAIDYWRRVGGQNIGFVGAEGQGRPITGFSKNRALLFSKIGVENSQTSKFESIFRERVKSIDTNGGITAEQYKDRKASAKESFATLLDDALAENGLSKDDFNKILNFNPKPQDFTPVVDTTKDPRIVKVFEAVRSKMIEANAKKFGEPAPDGSTFGLNVTAKLYNTSWNQQVFNKSMVEWQTLLAHSLGRYAGLAKDQDKKQQDAVKDFMASKDGKALKKKIRKAFEEAKVIQEDPKWTEGITNHVSKTFALRNQRIAAFKKIKSGVGKILNVYLHGSEAFEILDAEEIIAWLDGKDNEKLDKFVTNGSKPKALANASNKFAEKQFADKLGLQTFPKKDLLFEWHPYQARANFNPFYSAVNCFSSGAARFEFDRNVDGKINPKDFGNGYYKCMMFHELSHWAEHLDSEISDAAFRFLEDRVGSESVKTHASLTGGKLSSTEVGFSDQFTDVYVGRVYDMKEYSATEVTTMGVQQFSYPEKMAALYRDDRDLFYHACGVIFGSYGKSANV